MTRKTVKQVLIQALTENKANLQFLQECMSNIKQKRRPVCSEVSFLTDAITPSDVMKSTGMVGYILWVPRDELRRIESGEGDGQ